MNSYEEKYDQLRKKLESKSITSSTFLKELNNLCIDAMNQGQIAWHLYFKSRKLFEEKKYKELYITVDDLIKSFENSSLLNNLKPLSMAMVDKGLALIHQDKFDEAITVCDDVIKRFSAKTVLRDQIARAMFHKSIALDQKYNLDEAITVCDDVIKRFGEENEPLILEIVYRALVNKGSMLIDQGKNDEAIAVYDSVIEGFGKEKEPSIRKNIVTAMVNKGNDLFYQGQHDEAIAIYDNVIERFGKEKEPSISKQIEKALGKKYIILWKQGKLDFSNTEYNRELFVAFAGNLFSTEKALEATKNWENGNYQKAIDTFHEAWKINNDNFFVPTIIHEAIYKMIESGNKELDGIFDYIRGINDCLPKYIVMADYYVRREDYKSALPLLKKCIKEEEHMLRIEGYEEITGEILEAYHPLFLKHSKYLYNRKDITQSSRSLKMMYIRHNAFKGICHLEMREPGLAAETFEKILENFPEEADMVYHDYAVSLYASGREEEAENILEKIDLEDLKNSRGGILFLFIGMNKLCKNNILESYEMLSIIEEFCKSKAGLDVFLVHGCYHFVEAIKTYMYDIDYEGSLKIIDKSIKWLSLSKDSFLLVAEKMRDIIVLNNKFDALLNCNSLSKLSDESHKLRREFDLFMEKLKKDEPKQQTNLGLKTPAFYYGLLARYLYKLHTLMFLDYALHFIEEKRDLRQEFMRTIIEDNIKNNETPYGERVAEQLESIISIINKLSIFKSLRDISEEKEKEILKILAGVKPELSIEDYDRIIDILQNMGLVMERSPDSFAGMREEDLRTHFLVHLNGLYKGRATGETFNSKGKTDILVRGVDGKNIFIAECKFWAGPKSLQDTIDQLLSYLSWRDVNVAILLFNRKKEFSKVLAQIPEAIRTHPNYKRNFEQRKETEFRFILKSNIDENQELIATLLAFDVPKQRIS